MEVLHQHTHTIALKNLGPFKFWRFPLLPDSWDPNSFLFCYGLQFPLNRDLGKGVLQVETLRLKLHLKHPKMCDNTTCPQEHYVKWNKTDIERLIVMARWGLGTVDSQRNASQSKQTSSSKICEF